MKIGLMILSRPLESSSHGCHNTSDGCVTPILANYRYRLLESHPSTSQVACLWVPYEQGLDSGLRDRALLLVGFAVALRRSDIIVLNVSDLESDTGGVKVSIITGQTPTRRSG
jgi:site-specific recombinase XerD